jgi:hypothetical protein
MYAESWQSVTSLISGISHGELVIHQRFVTFLYQGSSIWICIWLPLTDDFLNFVHSENRIWLSLRWFSAALSRPQANLKRKQGIILSNVSYFLSLASALWSCAFRWICFLCGSSGAVYEKIWPPAIDKNRHCIIRLHRSWLWIDMASGHRYEKNRHCIIGLQWSWLWIVMASGHW